MRALKDAGGGRLEMIDKGRQALFVSLQTLGPVSAGQQLGRGISAFRYRGRSQVDDYLVELEHFSGSLVSINVGDHGDMRPYWGGGIDVVRMKREGSVVVRDAPRVTQKDWGAFTWRRDLSISSPTTWPSVRRHSTSILWTRASTASTTRSTTSF